MFYCPKCKKYTNFKHRDYVYRIKKLGGGKKEKVKVERVKCVECGRLQRVLLDDMIPYKQYSKTIIDGVRSGQITNDQLEYEDYPCELTIKRWNIRE